MRVFLWFVLALTVLGLPGKAIWLARGEFPCRTARGTAADMIFDVLLVFWVVFLLMEEASRG